MAAEPARSIRRLAPAIAIGLVLVSCSGCEVRRSGPSASSIVAEYRPSYDSLRQELVALVPLTNRARPLRPRSPLDPAPIYDTTISAANTDALMAVELGNPDTSLSAGNDPDLALSHAIGTGLRWTGPRNPMYDPEGPVSDATWMRGMLERPLRIHYLLVVRIISFDPPVATSDTTYRAGAAHLRGVLIDRPARRVACAADVRGTTSDSVEYRAQPSESRQRALERWAWGSLITAVRTPLLEALQQACGGSFTPPQPVP